ncbi:DMT family transporter [Alicyclobacillus fastidiosus]|uniref:DMT family transporter n=1 Tax=Alicyclobacillus fastidiosus TaxID=392011 RepID=A0ABY6ZHV7_9BACL|nr:DMT family transporter [Alicyclobacillus fastidiosus]WAH42432.1 DMT family transporter [Alicyclobacillus fastidiosus]GMA64257.1 transporter [Alicyclobacillus fastidiosus]
MRYYILLMLTSLLWAGNFVTGKFLVGHASPLTLTDLRWAIADIFLVPVVWISDKKLFPPLRALVPLVFMGLTGVIFFNVFTYLALTRTTPDNVGLLSALNPIAIAIASFIFLKEKLSVRQVIGMVVSLCGVVVVVTKGRISGLTHFQVNSGVWLMLAAVGMWGLYAVASRSAMKYVSPYMATLWAGLLGVLFMLPFDLPKLTSVQLNTPFWSSILYGAIGGTVVAMILWNIGIQRVGETKSGMFLNFNPIFTAALAYVLMGETVHVSQIVGTLIVIAGVSLFAIPKAHKRLIRQAA